MLICNSKPQQKYVGFMYLISLLKDEKIVLFSRKILYKYKVTLNIWKTEKDF